MIRRRKKRRTSRPGSQSLRPWPPRLAMLRLPRQAPRRPHPRAEEPLAADEFCNIVLMHNSSPGSISDGQVVHL